MLGARIKIRAVPYPLPAEASANLIAAGQRVTQARKLVEQIKEGCTPQKDSAIDEYESVMDELITAESFIRRTYGVEYVREEILPLKGICK